MQSPHAPRLLVLVNDLLLTVIALMAAVAVRFEFNIPPTIWEVTIPALLATLLPLRLLAFLISRSYRNSLRYSTSHDAIVMVSILLITSLMVAICEAVCRHFDNHFTPYSIVVIETCFSSVALLGLRAGIRLLYINVNSRAHQHTVALYGQERELIRIKRSIERDVTSRYSVLALFCADRSSGDMRVDGVSRYTPEGLESFLSHKDVDLLILGTYGVSVTEREWVVRLCTQYGVRILTPPSVDEWLNPDLSQLRPIRIEDLLTRAPINLDMAGISSYISGKTVLVTGGAGSIGSELARQIARFKPARLLVLDQAETPLYQIELELREQLSFNLFDPIIGTLADEERMRRIFTQYRPSVVFHAGAYKHVPMMELHPYEAVRNNVFPTQTLANLAVEFGAEAFVMVSTDKAVNPTNVMGASKRICELYVQALSRAGVTTRFVTTRFGNVLGSNGSVIARFQEQIAAGGPLTVTHPEVERFFMSIPEACQLVLEAGTMGKGGEIYVFDMGAPSRIADLARKMIILAGKQPDLDIKIEYIGLRPGEKLYEEVLSTEEGTLPTPHPRIRIARVREAELTAIRGQLAVLAEAMHSGDSMAIVRCMKQMVPEFKSQNSPYEELDNALVGQA